MTQTNKLASILVSNLCHLSLNVCHTDDEIYLNIKEIIFMNVFHIKFRQLCIDMWMWVYMCVSPSVFVCVSECRCDVTILRFIPITSHQTQYRKKKKINKSSYGSVSQDWLPCERRALLTENGCYSGNIFIPIVYV